MLRRRPGRSQGRLPGHRECPAAARAGAEPALRLPLVDVLWTREVEAGPIDTPERRAALERRLLEAIKAITDETLRRHYRQDIEARLAGLFGPAPGQAGGGARSFRRPVGSTVGSGTGRFGRPGGFAPPPRVGFAEAPAPASASLARSALFAPGRVSFSHREALILALAINHPGLAARYSEELAGVDFASRDLARIMSCVLERLANPFCGVEEVRASISAAGLGEPLDRVEKVAGQSTAWCVRPDAEERDAEEVLKQALALHRRARALHKELKSAEIALGTEATDANLDRLRDIQAELSGIEGREAVVEGFGLSVGRQNTGL